jgi:hypothetical protein
VALFSLDAVEAATGGGAWQVPLDSLTTIGTIPTGSPYTTSPGSTPTGRVLSVNCGSVGKPRDGVPRGGFACSSPTSTFVAARIERFRYDARAVAREVAAAGRPGKYADKLVLAT